MTTIKEIYDFIDRSIAPFGNALSFDNVGLLVGNKEREVSKVLLALDITRDVCAEASSLGAELIISHHPIIFKPLKSIQFDSALADLVTNKISAICAHTNLDVAPRGVNFQLASKLGLKRLSALTYEEEKPMGLVGYLDAEMSATEFVEFVKKSLDCSAVRHTSINDRIKKVAVCSGSGGSFIGEAHAHSADAFVVGEIKHSDILKANALGVNIIDTGHYKSENVIIEPLKNMLGEAFRGVELFISREFSDNIKYL